MAKKSIVERAKKRIRLVEKYKNRRAELKNVIKSATDYNTIAEAQVKLARLPVNSNPIRNNSRCTQCGRQHAVYRRFKLCRICLRMELMDGNIAGGRKSSW